MMVRAPGKAFLSGEYAVLHGAPATVLAVDRHARARLVPASGATGSPFIAELLKRIPPPADMLPLVESAALHSRDGSKLGLGASAAVTVAAAGALFAAAGRDPTKTEERAELTRLCIAAHRAAQGGRGSGGDVAASVYGGVIRFRRRGDDVEVTASAVPEGFRVRFYRLGGPASTVAILRRVEELAACEEARHSSLMGALTGAAESYEEQPVTSLRTQLRHLAALGEAVGVSIVPKSCWALAAAAEAHGGAAKPSGAGGGDLAVALVPVDREAAFDQVVGLPPLSLAIEQDGVSPEAPD